MQDAQSVSSGGVTGGLPVSFADIERAAARIAGHVHRTPLVTSHRLDALLGCRLVLKYENLQRTGAFKARGAHNAVLAPSDAQVIEPSAAVPVAALLERKFDLAGRAVGVILTGGNVDLERLPWQLKPSPIWERVG